jgi:uncharacterized membrane protein HdeD (DUF308 family)
LEGNVESLDTVRWSSVLLRGILGIIFGIVLLAWPKGTISVVIWVFGIFAIAAGMVGATMAASARHERQHWLWSVVGGIASMGVGIAVLVWPQASAKLVLVLIAIMALVWGLSDILLAIGIRKEASTFSVVMMTLAGLISVAFGIYAFANPGKGAVAIIWLIAVYAIAWGVMLAIASFAIRSGQKSGGGDVRPA